MTTYTTPKDWNEAAAALAAGTLEQTDHEDRRDSWFHVPKDAPLLTCDGLSRYRIRHQTKLLEKRTWTPNKPFDVDHPFGILAPGKPLEHPEATVRCWNCDKDVPASAVHECGGRIRVMPSLTQDQRKVLDDVLRTSQKNIHGVLSGTNLEQVAAVAAESARSFREAVKPAPAAEAKPLEFWAATFHRGVEDEGNCLFAIGSIYNSREACAKNGNSEGAIRHFRDVKDLTPMSNSQKIDIYRKAKSESAASDYMGSFVDSILRQLRENGRLL